ncbi:MAG TPA: hypothetical protein VGO86_01230 [Candidatus Dormibacteraeota bacterium]
MASIHEQPHPEHGPLMVARHRVALELEVDRRPDEIEPEDWDLHDLAVALDRGVARPVRTIRGLVVDPENDRLSITLAALADDIDEITQPQWLARASMGLTTARPAGTPRLSLELLVILDQFAASTRHLARRLDEQDH